MKLSPPRVVSTTAAIHGPNGHYKHTSSTEVQYRMRGLTIPAQKYPSFDRSGLSVFQHPHIAV